MTNTTIHTPSATQSPQTIAISVAYAPTQTEHIYLELAVPLGADLFDALVQSGILTEHPDVADWCNTHRDDSKVDNKFWRVGVYSIKQPLSYILKPNDRVEIYRPLSVDPMKKRKKRATQQ